MKYVGIDLGTTNSAICSFDGEAIRLYKSPEQYDVTPSAIFIDKRGNKYVGSRAYNNAARNPDNAATLFKRLMGTSTQVKLPAVDMTLTPEECSAEILRVLFGYLPEEIRGDDTLHVLNCGHPWPYLLGDGRAVPLAATEPLPPMGPFPLPAQLPAEVCGRLKLGDTLFLHTDGVEEARDDYGRFFALAEVLA